MSGALSPKPPRRRSFRALTGSFGLTFKISAALHVFLRIFALAQGRPSSVSRLPGSILESEKRRFSWFFATRARSVLTSCEVYETLHWLTKIEVRAFHDRNKNDEKSIRTPLELAHAFEDGFRAPFDGPRAANLASKTANMAA